MRTVVELEGVNGEWFTLAGPNAGDRGVWLTTGVTGLFDPPVKVVYEEPGNYPGARYLNHRILRRDIVFAVEIPNDRSNIWLSNDSQWRKAWAFDRDCILRITTEESGTRFLKLRLGESPDISLTTDPNGNACNKVGMVCISGDPFWYEDDVVYTATTQEDTTFDPNPLPWPWPQHSIPTETLYITVDPSDGKGGLNPTDQAIFPKWTVPGSTLAPAEPYIPGLPWLGAPKSPATIWTIPDYSFDDPEHANRRLRLPGLIGGLRTEEIQAIFLTGKPTGGTFTLTYDGQTTLPIAYNASTAAVEAAIVALSNITFGDVDVTRDSVVKEVQTITIDGTPTGGTWTLTVDGQTTAPIPYDAHSGTVEDRLQALPNILNADISVTGIGTNEVQSVQRIGEPTGGTFTLTFDGHTTSAIPWNASSYTVQSKLRALPNIANGSLFGLFGVSDVVVTRADGTYQPYIVKFQGAKSDLDVPQITADPSLLTGGAGIDVVVTTKTEGSRLFKVVFTGSLGGFDFPTMTADSSGLTGGTDPTVNVVTSIDGSHPYLVRFQGNLQGIDVPMMSVDPSGLTGIDVGEGRVEQFRKGTTAPAENVIVNSDPREEQVVSESGSQIWSRMNGVRFRYPIPSYTRDKTFEITVSGCEPGQSVALRLPRPWSRPWGLE